MDEHQAKALPVEMFESVEVRCVASFGLGDQLVRAGEVVTVSHARANYLRFLGLVEWL